MKRRTFPPNSREEWDTNAWAAKQVILVDDRYFQVTVIFLKGYLINVTILHLIEQQVLDPARGSIQKALCKDFSR